MTLPSETSVPGTLLQSRQGSTGALPGSQVPHLLLRVTTPFTQRHVAKVGSIEQ